MLSNWFDNHFPWIFSTQTHQYWVVCVFFNQRRIKYLVFSSRLRTTQGTKDHHETLCKGTRCHNVVWTEGLSCIGPCASVLVQAQIFRWSRSSAALTADLHATGWLSGFDLASRASKTTPVPRLGGTRDVREASRKNLARCGTKGCHEGHACGVDVSTIGQFRMVQTRPNCCVKVRVVTGKFHIECISWRRRLLVFLTMQKGHDMSIYRRDAVTSSILIDSIDNLARHLAIWICPGDPGQNWTNNLWPMMDKSCSVHQTAGVPPHWRGHRAHRVWKMSKS